MDDLEKIIECIVVFVLVLFVGFPGAVNVENFVIQAYQKRPNAYRICDEYRRMMTFGERVVEIEYTLHEHHRHYLSLMPTGNRLKDSFLAHAREQLRNDIRREEALLASMKNKYNRLQYRLNGVISGTQEFQKLLL